MFTGITGGTGRIVSTGNNLIISAGELIKGLEIGASVAVNGVCLTVTGIKDVSFYVDVMPETLKRTNLGLLRVGDKVNLERAATLGSEMGGHLVQGHIDDTGKIVSIAPEGDALLISIGAPPGVMRYVVEKGFIAVDGVSLTVVSRDESSFRVSIVEHTRKNTTMGVKKVGDTVNLEVDIIAKYVERFASPERPRLTTEFLRDHGF